MKKTRPSRLSLLAGGVVLLSGCNTLALRDAGPVADAPQAPAIEHTSSGSATAQPAVPEKSVQAMNVLPPAEGLGAESNAKLSAAEDVHQDDLWLHIRDRLQLPVVDERRVEAQYNWYKGHPDYLRRVSERASPYLYLIVDEVEKRGLPLDLALLPIVESAFDPFAYSHGRAAGIWQFIPSTGRHFGLEQNWWYDGRRDIPDATRAALDYLSALNKRFDGDWLLALAAYNAGGGTVNRAITRNKKRGKPTDFWHLDLPRETEHYVPKLLALSRILRETSASDTVFTPVANRPRLALVELPGQTDLSVAAKIGGMSLEELRRLNPAYNRWATPPEGPHHLLVPNDQAERLRVELASLDEKDRVRWKRHKVASGQTLSHIAQRYDVSTQAIRQANNLRGDLIRAGKYLLIPVAGEVAPAQGETRTTHVVAAGDTLWDIARRYDTSTDQLLAWNGLDAGSFLQPGQELRIFSANAGGSSSAANINRRIRYTVRKGDSLYTIAQRFNVSIRDLRRWNKLEGERYLQPGQTLTLLVDITRASEG